MTPINKEVVTRLFSEIDQATAKLHDLSLFSEDKFLSDSKNYDSAKYNLIVAVEALIDLCNHIIAQEKREIGSNLRSLHLCMLKLCTGSVQPHCTTSAHC
jgi:uncharacterized protein YutE (UPF0331/DUF86 family)